jgi:hypothetical protein
LTLIFALDKVAALSEPSSSPPEKSRVSAPNSIQWKTEGAGIITLAAMLVYFLVLSWRRWPDPIVDFGQQIYDVWRVSHGAMPYHDFMWSYGPVSIYFNACLFKIFGPGIMVLATANLIIYGGILTLAYLVFRTAWGWQGAFAAVMVFICIFSFSHLLGVGNYNYATPYAAESVHGMLLILAAAFVVMKWYRRKSLICAFLLGLCGGVSAVMKPEFMLALGVLGMAAVGLRLWHCERVSVGEIGLLAAGTVLPTLFFTLWFARTESWSAAFEDASQAWWLVVVTHVQSESGQQLSFSGLNHPLGNIIVQLEETILALLVMAAAWAAGWSANRPWSVLVRIIMIIAAFALAGFVRFQGGWLGVGRCLPGLMFIAFAMVSARLWREIRVQREAQRETVMALVLVSLGGTMLARMLLFARIFHLGFFQAALAGMIVAALMVVEIPRWVGPGSNGQRVAAIGGILVLVAGCCSIAIRSRVIRLDQTEPVGAGRDRFYATTRTIDGTGALVNWAAEQLEKTPPDSTVMVLPGGEMINYLARRRSMEPGWTRGGGTDALLREMQTHAPDYVIFITRDLTEFGVKRFGAAGEQGVDIRNWVAANYNIMAGLGGDPLAVDDHPGALILQHKKN